ncbi:hypothetical protein HG530_011323 [Fusarium avenaceum]|nr:hypothetical protein HG530_011323 [Fusarium avenaceum]
MLSLDVGDDFESLESRLKCGCATRSITISSAAILGSVGAGGQTLVRNQHETFCFCSNGFVRGHLSDSSLTSLRLRRRFCVLGVRHCFKECNGFFGRLGGLKH